MTSAIRKKIEAEGPISFAMFHELALYGPDGFFEGDHVVGRDGHFVTSPTVGSMFGRVLADAIDHWWDELGRPPIFDLVECGGGDGALAVAILPRPLRCREALRYTLVEQSSAARMRAAERLGAERGLRIVDSIPDEPIVGVIFANELLDNLPVRLVEMTEAGPREVGVTIASGKPSEVLLQAGETLGERLNGRSFDVPGRRWPICVGAVVWLTSAIAHVERGRVVCIDYTRTTAEMAALPQEDWLRTYNGHRRGRHPLDCAGAQDITCDVAIDQLLSVVPGLEVETQADFLHRFGIAALRTAARARWRAAAAKGGLDALHARSEVDEIAALTSTVGLGAFSVMQKAVGLEGAPNDVRA